MHDSLIHSQPWKFGALIPICGGPRAISFLSYTSMLHPRLRDSPIILHVLASTGGHYTSWVSIFLAVYDNPFLSAVLRKTHAKGLACVWLLTQLSEILETAHATLAIMLIMSLIC